LKEERQIFHQVYLVDQKVTIRNSSVQSDGAAIAYVP